ncbi:MAG: protease HtpX [Elusimicrobia bacterium]|nr:protease HtpX [Elusimicrobiota bacterium]MDE2237146.1 protease HtpX [Elusimicrobiota bacterium]MDE2424550.1 protease HtpX [Elusimicrobiota bacterium]
MKRFMLFLLTNILVVVVISVLIDVLGARPYMTARGIDYHALLVFSAIVGFTGAFISLQMSRWMAKRGLGVRLIDPHNPGGDFEASLVARVQRLCQAAGLETLPEIGVYDSPEVNAFATGPSRRRALLAISSGLLNRMDDQAIDGVLGHEISHIVNGDMVTMTLLQGVVNTFVVFASRIIMVLIEQAVSSDSDERGGLGFFAQYILVMALESVLMLLASPIIYWYSRRREYGADAGSARLTGRETMIHALEQLRAGPRLRDDRAPSVSAFKIDGHGHGILQFIYSTHPPLEARIEALKRQA